MKGLLDAVQNPLVLMGLSGFARAARGDDVTGGWTAGADMASSLQSQQMRRQAADEDERRKKLMQQFLSGPSVSGLPPALRDIAQITGDLGSVQSWITGAGDRAWQAKSRARQEQEWGRDDSTWAEDRDWTRKTRSQTQRGWAEADAAAAEEKKARAAGIYANLYQMAGGDPAKLQRLEATARAAGFDVPAEFSGEGGGEAAMAVAGRLPQDNRTGLSPTAQKELFEAEDVANSSAAAISSLNRALELDEKAYSGLMANERAAIGGVFGADGALAAQELNNVITGQALENLKAIFGASPTEGERQLLLQIQGSIEQPAEVRKAVLQRALAAAQNRMRLSQERAQLLRSGKYFSPDRPSGEAPVVSGAFDTIEQALQNAPPGSVIRDTMTGKRYRRTEQGLEEVP